MLTVLVGANRANAISTKVSPLIYTYRFVRTLNFAHHPNRRILISGV
jgi:hypothetical protein